MERGGYISSNLNWDIHVNRVAASANKSLGMIRCNVRTKSPKIREMAYKTIVRPHLEYASVLWDTHTMEQTP